MQTRRSRKTFGSVCINRLLTSGRAEVQQVGLERAGGHEGLKVGHFPRDSNSMLEEKYCALLRYWWPTGNARSTRNWSLTVGWYPGLNPLPLIATMAAGFLTLPSWMGLEHKIF